MVDEGRLSFGGILLPSFPVMNNHLVDEANNTVIIDQLLDISGDLNKNTQIGKKGTCPLV